MNAAAASASRWGRLPIEVTAPARNAICDNVTGSTLVIARTTRKSVAVTSPPTDPWWLPWAMRLSWLALPFTTGAVLADALDERSTEVQTAAAVLAWAAWAIVVLGLLVRRPVALTALRIVAP